jgi:hypothetical protein
MGVISVVENTDTYDLFDAILFEPLKYVGQTLQSFGTSRRMPGEMEN